MDGLARAHEAARSADARARWCVEQGAHAQRARQSAVDSALVVEPLIAAVFDQVASHRQWLGERVRSERKRASQRVSNSFVALHALRRAHAAHTRRPAHGDDDDDEGMGAHAQRLLSRQGPGQRVAVRVEFRLPPAAWGVACRLRVRKRVEWAATGAALSPLPPVPVPTHAHASAVVDNAQAFVVGGYTTPQGCTNACRRLDLRERAWHHAPPMPTPRFECGACVVHGTVVVVAGGRDAQGGGLDAVEAFNSATGRWWSLPALPARTYGCAVVAWDDKVVVAGGRSGPWFLSTVVALDVPDPALHDAPDLGPGPRERAWESLPPMRSSRYGLGGAVGHDALFVCGGYSGFACLDTCEQLDLATGRWGALPPMPARLSMCGCCYGGGNVFVVGGWDPKSTPSRLGTVFVLDTATSSWATLRLPTPRDACTAVCGLRRRLVVVGGHGGEGCLDDCTMFAFE